MKKIKLFVITLFFMGLSLGSVNSFVLSINNDIKNKNQIPVVLEADIGLDHIYGLLFKYLNQKEKFYIYNYFYGLTNNMNTEAEILKEKDNPLLIVKYLYLPVVGFLNIFLFLAMIINILRYNSIFPIQDK